MNIVLTFSQYAAVLTKFNSIIGRKFEGEAGVLRLICALRGRVSCIVLAF